MPFVDHDGGGFYGLVRNDRSFDAAAPKGLVMHSRFLWTYSAAYMRYAKSEYLDAARTAYDYLRGPQADAEAGGFWWAMEGSPGKPTTDVKLVYGQAFAIYALSEFYRATGEAAALELALKTYDLLERVARDRKGGGSSRLATDIGNNRFGSPLAKWTSAVTSR